MIEKFLKAKHWQLFSLIFGIPFLFQIFMMITMLSSIQNANPSDVPQIFEYMWFFPIIMVMVMGIQFGWFWSIAIGLQNKVPQGVKMKVKKFKVFFFFPVIYLSLLCIGMMTLFYSFTIEGIGVNGGLVAALLGIIIPMHLFAVFCVFYSIYFVAKTFKTVELQREVGFGDFMGEFLMIWFYPLGIWIIQPKVNRITEN